jgi:predicted short-subunit dehydrogenase-like oxidoreductase (DUF2520 family)
VPVFALSHFSATLAATALQAFATAVIQRPPEILAVCKLVSFFCDQGRESGVHTLQAPILAGSLPAPEAGGRREKGVRAVASVLAPSVSALRAQVAAVPRHLLTKKFLLIPEN